MLLTSRLSVQTKTHAKHNVCIRSMHIRAGQPGFVSGLNHPTVGFALFGTNVSERLGPSREELPVSNDNFTSVITVLVLALRNVGLRERISRSHVSGEILSSRQELRNFAAPLPRDDA